MVTATPDSNPQPPAATGVDPAPAGATTAPPLGKWLLIYTLLRIGTLVVLTALLSLLMPLILALLFAVVLATRFEGRPSSVVDRQTRTDG